MTHFDTVEDYDSVMPKHITSYFLHKKINVIIDMLQHHLDASSPLIGLDLGCGTGDIVTLLSKRLRNSHVCGIDNSRQMLSHAARKHPDKEFIFGNMMELPFPENHFDFVVATNSLHHLSNRQEQLQVLSEVNRVLKQKAVFIINEMNTKNPVISLYWKHLFPMFREFELGNEVHIDEELIEDTSLFDILDVSHYTFVPDFCPSFLVNLAIKVDELLDRSPICSLGCHFTIAAMKT